MYAVLEHAMEDAALGEAHERDVHVAGLKKRNLAENRIAVMPMLVDGILAIGIVAPH